MEGNIRIFKVNYSEELFEPEVKKTLDLFTLNNIICVYVRQKKRMYIWIGKSASQSLKNVIPKIRSIASGEHEDMVILRYITIESGSEPSEFFDMIDFSKKELEEYVNYQETKLAPVISEINDLRENAEVKIKSEEFDAAIVVAKDIIKLAKEIDDIALEKDQEEFIQAVTAKSEAKKLQIRIEEDNKAIEKIEKILEESSELEKLSKFEEAVLSIEGILESTQKRDLPKYKEKLEVRKKELLEAGEKYIKINKEISNLEEKIGETQEKKNLNDTLEYCEKLIQLAESIDKKELMEKYSTLLEEVREKLKAKALIISEIGNLREQAKNKLISEEYDDAIEVSKDIVKLAKEIDDIALEKDQEEFIKDVIAKSEAKKLQIRIEEDSKLLNKILEKSLELQNQSKFEEAVLIIKGILESTQKHDLPNFKERIEERKKELLDAEENFIKIKKEISNLEEKISENQEKQHLNAAIKYCEKLIQLARNIKLLRFNGLSITFHESKDKKDLIEKYSTLLKGFREELETKIQSENEEKEKILSKGKEIQNVIKMEEDTMPILEEFSVSELLGDLSSDMNDMLEQIGSLLSVHRVEVKREIKNKVLLTSASGEVIEEEKIIEVQESGGPEDLLQCNVQSGLENPFDDAIEEAILTDLIPYNFEITNIELNGKVVEELPDKSLSKEGLELTWKIQNIPPKEKVEIKYDLRRKISRTLIFILEGQVKIIKTHFNLSNIGLEGIYDAKLPLTNNYGLTLDGVVVEDIIPLYYLHFIKAPTKISPVEVSSSKIGEFIKWNVGSLSAETMNYHYRLLELYRLEEIKISITNLSKKGINSVNKKNLTEALKNYDEIISQLEEYNQ